MSDKKLFPYFYVGLSIQLGIGVGLLFMVHYITDMRIFVPLAFFSIFPMLVGGGYFYKKAGF